MARLPEPGNDAGNWGDILNDYLLQSHTNDGIIKPDAIDSSQIKSGAVTTAKIQGIGTSNGIAPLDGGAKIPETYVPSRLSPSELASSTAKSIAGDTSFSGTSQQATIKTISSAGFTTRSTAKAAGKSAAGMVALLFDDGWLEHFTVVAPLLEARGFRATFAVNPATFSDESNRMTSAQLAILHSRGHEIANHTMSHVNMTTQSSADRATAWDDANTAITAAIGETPTTFVYPFNATALAIDQQAYLRFERVFAGNATPFIENIGDRDTFLHGRYSWSNDSASIHQRAMANVRRAAHEDVIFTLFTHKVNGESGSITLAQLTELLDACVTLGIPVVPTNEAFPNPIILPDAGFEIPDARFLSMSGLNTTNTYSKPVITPDDFKAGTRALRFSGDGTSTMTALQVNYIPIRSSEPWVVSARFKQSRTSGGGSSLLVREYDSYGIQIGSDVVSATLATTFDWQQVILDYTPSTSARSFRVGVRQVTMVGATDYDHMALDLKRRPILG